MSVSEESEIAPADEPIALFKDWFEEAKAREPNDPEAMALATVDAGGLPNVRMVLLKGVDHNGFVFYTNLESAKGEELAGNPQAGLCFHWKSLRRQVRVRGTVMPVSDAEADAYFKTRAKDSQIGAWASRQSRRPPHWSGFRLQPLAIEFWRNRPFRLHERLLYARDSLDSPWVTSRLFP